MNKLINAIAIMTAIATSASALPEINEELNKKIGKTCFKAAATQSGHPLNGLIKIQDEQATLKDATDDVANTTYELKYRRYPAEAIKLTNTGLIAKVIVRTEKRWKTSSQNGWTEQQDKTSYQYHECVVENISRSGEGMIPVALTTYDNAEDKTKPLYLAHTTGTRKVMLDNDYDVDYYSWRRNFTQSRNGTYVRQVSGYIDDDNYIPEPVRPYWNFGD